MGIPGPVLLFVTQLAQCLVLGLFGLSDFGLVRFVAAFSPEMNDKPMNI
jgi:hypothetical protein